MIMNKSLIKSSVILVTLSLVLAAFAWSPISAYMNTASTGRPSILSNIKYSEKLSRTWRALTVAVAPLFFQGQGVAPTGDPGQGFDIDGDLAANAPTANTTDWVAGGAGTGAGLLSNTGAPVDPLKTFHIIDSYNSNADNIFSGGKKYTDNPNTWTWTTQKATAKDDLNNGLLHTSNDINNHLWLTVASDRFSTSGNSYIDFEFFQSVLTANDNGTFTSAGPDGGRTVGDLLITLELTMGGTQPNFFVERWQQVSPGVFSYIPITPAANTVFAAANVNGTVPVPYGAFGSTTYAMNAFAEGAIDISALIANLDPCILIRTVLIKSKASQEATANLKDFITPIQLNLGTSPAADAGLDLIECQINPGPNVFTVNGTATNGSPSWSVIGSTGTASATIISPSNAMTDVNVTGVGTITLRLSVSDPTCGIATDEVVLEVTPNAVADAGADQTKCEDLAAGTTVFTIESIVTAGSTVNWLVTNSTGTANATVVNPTSPSTDIIVSGTGTVTLQISADAGVCGIATDTIVLTVNPSPTAAAGANQTKCQDPGGTTTFTLAGSVTNGTPSWSIVGSTQTAVASIASPNSSNTIVNVSGSGTVTLALISTGNTAPGCGTATSEVVLTVNPLPGANAGQDKALTCSTTAVQLDGSSATQGATFNWTGPNNFTSNSASPTVTAPGTYTMTVTNPTNGCSAVDIVEVTQDISQIDATITALSSVCAGSTGNTASVPDAGQGAIYNWSITNGTITGGQGTRNLIWTADPSGTVTLSVTVSTGVNGCTASGNKMTAITTLPNTQIMAPVSVCESAPDNSASVPDAGTGATYQWSITNGTITGGQGTTNIMWTAGSGGSATINVIVNAGSGCNAGGSIAVPITIQPTADAGPDQSVPACTTSVQLAGSIGGGATGATWSGGQGTFIPNANVLNPTYFPTQAELTAGSVTLTLSTDDPGNNCGPAGDDVVITLLACADLSLTKSLSNVSPVSGDNVVFTISLNNSGPGSATKVSVIDLLPAGLTYVTAVALQGSYNVNNGIWSLGTLGAGKTATLKITVIFNAGAENAVNCAEVYASDAFDPDSTPNNKSTAEDDYDCAQFQTSKGPGLPFPDNTEGSGQNAGSVLIFPVYSSNSVSPNLQNTRINLTNTSQARDIAVRLIFVDGSSCSASDATLCLTRNQTTSFIVSDFDPDITGYIIAIAIDCETGCPINFNCLIGDEYVKFASGHRGNIGAEAFNAVTGNPADCSDSSATATLKFDGEHYTRLPRTLIADSLPSRADGNDTMLVIDRIGGNMMTGANGLGSLFVLLFKDVVVVSNFPIDQGACQLRASLTSNFPRTVPRYDSHIPSGRSGWLKIFSKDEAPGGIIGVSINFNPNAAAVSTAFNGAHNLHHQALTSSAEMIIPVFPPNCC